MATFVADCPRCGASHVTLDILGDVCTGVEWNWKTEFEVFGRCRRCGLPSILEIHLRSNQMASLFMESGTVSKPDFDITPYFSLHRYVDVSVTKAKAVPAHLPSDINKAFEEGTRCLAVGCYNAAAAMFRLCLDLATRVRLPEIDGADGPTPHERRNLAPRLKWLFSAGLLPGDIEDLSSAVKGNGDEGAHEGSLTMSEAEDIYDFAYHLLERLYTQPARLKAAKERREARKLGGPGKEPD